MSGGPFEGLGPRWRFLGPCVAGPHDVVKSLLVVLLLLLLLWAAGAWAVTVVSSRLRFLVITVTFVQSALSWAGAGAGAETRGVREGLDATSSSVVVSESMPFLAGGTGSSDMMACTAARTAARLGVLSIESAWNGGGGDCRAKKSVGKRQHNGAWWVYEHCRTCPVWAQTTPSCYYMKIRTPVVSLSPPEARKATVARRQRASKLLCAFPRTSIGRVCLPPRSGRFGVALPRCVPNVLVVCMPVLLCLCAVGWTQRCHLRAPTPLGSMEIFVTLRSRIHRKEHDTVKQDEWLCHMDTLYFLCVIFCSLVCKIR